MRIIQHESSLGSHASLEGTRAQGGPPNAFQARLSAGGGAPSSIPGGTLPSGADILQQSFQEMRQLLHVQYQLSKGTTSLISNVLKTRHETAKNSIQNIR